MSELKNVEIQETENGYMVFLPAREVVGVLTAYPNDTEIWSFETFEALVEFLKGAISKFHREDKL
jgi:hypothetical protein